MHFYIFLRFPAELPFVHTGQYPQDLPHPAQAGEYVLHVLAHYHQGRVKCKI